MIKFGKIIALIFVMISISTKGQQPWLYNTPGERIITPAYRITENPSIFDTIIPSPTVQYPLLNRNMRTQITVTPIEPSKIKIVDPLDKLYPAYLKLGVGNYASPLGEFYFNSMRNRKVNYGIALKHNSSFGNIKGYAPSGFDNTTGRVFGDFFASQPIEEFEAQLIGQKHEVESLKTLFSQLDLVSYFGQVTAEEIIEGFK